MLVIADPESGRQASVPKATRSSTPTLLVACLPAVLAGLLIRVWLMRTALSALNADEGVTGLQAFDVLHGHFRLVVAGNEYGATTETYLFAPFLAFWTGVWPLRILPIVLSAGAGYALYRLALPVFGRVPALIIALIGWTTSGAMALNLMRAYMGYTTGLIAQVAALALACHAMRTDQKLARTAALAGFAAGFATWSHPVFGVVAVLALIAPTLYRPRSVGRWLLPLAGGGLIGASPWLVFIAQTGRLPEPAEPTVLSTYWERLPNFLTELLPRAFGLRTPTGDWVGPDAVAIAVAVLLIGASIVGMGLLVALKGRQALPILVAGLLAFPALAGFDPLGYVIDGRYAMPFLPELLMGLGAWLLLIPKHIRYSRWLLAIVPTMWALLLSVPLVHQQVGWQWVDPDSDAKLAVSELQSRQVSYIAGDYWTTYLIDYLGAGRFQAAVDYSVRLTDQYVTVTSADPSQVTFVYYYDGSPLLHMPLARYQVVRVGIYNLYVPVRS